MVLAISYTQQRVFVIFNFEKLTWNTQDKNVFIGYFDGVSDSYQNPFSNIDNSAINSSDISTSPGNTGLSI